MSDSGAEAGWADQGAKVSSRRLQHPCPLPYLCGLGADMPSLAQTFLSPSVADRQGQLQAGLAGMLSTAGPAVRPLSAANAFPPAECINASDNKLHYYFFVLLDWLLRCPPRALRGHLTRKYSGLAICRWFPLRQRQSETTSLSSGFSSLNLGCLKYGSMTFHMEAYLMWAS